MVLLTRTPRAARALTYLAMTLAGCLLAAACGGGSGHSGGNTNFTTPVAVSSPTAGGSSSPAATSSPAGPASPTPPATTGSFGVLAGPFTGVNYSVTLIGADGRVAAAAQASSPVSPTCAGQAVGLAPYPVSTSDSAAYFMDAQGGVKMLLPDGGAARGPLITLPIGPSTRSVFAVSPDGSKIAVAVIDYKAGGATTRLFNDELKTGGSQKLIFSETGSYILWPIGWHGAELVVAKVPSCTQGGGPGCCGPQELHVVDADTAARKAVVGGSGCLLVGPPSSAGAVCETTSQAQVLDWSGKTSKTYPIQGYTPALIAPDLAMVALVSSGSTVVHDSAYRPFPLAPCGWIDDGHMLVGGDTQRQPVVVNLTSGAVAPVAAQGDCAGRIPGAL